MSSIKSIALVNELGQVVNHVMADTDDVEVIEMLHAVWGTTRYVDTTMEDVIVLHKDDDVWTTHCDDPVCEQNGFNLPSRDILLRIAGVEETQPAVTHIETVTINGRVYPKDSLLIKENASTRPEGWILPEGQEEVSMADVD